MTTPLKQHGSVAVIGAGPAGLTAAYLLAQKGMRVTVLESDPEYVGGIARTVRYKGFHFDIGGHRFFSKSERIQRFWREILPNDFLERPRSSRIYYRKQFFAYPLAVSDALKKLGPLEAMRCVMSFSKSKLLPIRPVKSFEDWVVNQFGRRLFTIFFKTYTEKVWGIKCDKLSADWAAQRIKGLSLGKAILHAFLPETLLRKTSKKGEVVKTLINSFHYPRKGPGMMWEACAEKIRAMGGDIRMACEVVSLHQSNDQTSWRISYQPRSGDAPQSIEADEVICSAPMRNLASMVHPPFSQAARDGAKALKYRDFLTVMVILKDRGLFSDNWIYIHDPNVKVGRIQNFKSWSPEMVPDPDYICYGLEYFCFEGDELWESSDEGLIKLAKHELRYLGLAQPSEIVDGRVVRQPKAYPVFDEFYIDHVGIIRREIECKYPGLHLVGRNGMHKYNNQDHSMMTAMLAVENILGAKPLYDLWSVNQDAEYIESEPPKT